MKDELTAFQQPIEEGLIRILLCIDKVVCEVKNDAPDFVDPLDDKPVLTITPENDLSGITRIFSERFKLELDKRESSETELVWELASQGIWFDIEMDSVKEVWLTKFDFYIESSKPRYLTYNIRDVEHHIEWLQVDSGSGEIRKLSSFNKEFEPPPVSNNDIYTGYQVLKCANMIARAAKKIDIRTQRALVKFNTDKGNLEPLIIGMADRLGYIIKALDKKTITNLGEKGENVSHSIQLK